jgi:WD40 repeat protein
MTVAFDPEGEALASGTFDGTIVLWYPNRQGAWVRERTFKGDELVGDMVSKNSITVAFTPNGKQLVGCCAGTGGVRFWRLGDGEPLPGLRVAEGFAGQLALSADGQFLAANCGGQDGWTVRVWHLPTRRVVQELSPRVGVPLAVAFSPDGKFLACGGRAGVAMFETDTFQRRLHTIDGEIHAVAFTPDSRRLAYGVQDYGTRLWDVVTNREIATLAPPPKPGEVVEEGWVFSIAPSPDGRTVVSARDKSLVLWDLGGADESRLLEQFAGGVPGVAFSFRGNLLASVSKDSSVALWDASTGRLVRRLKGGEGECQAVSFSHDGRLLAVGELSGQRVRIWDVESGRSVAALNPKLGGVWSVSFGGDGRSFVAGGDKGWVIWAVDQNRAGGEKQLVLRETVRRQIPTGVGCLCFTPDGSLLAWVERNNTFHLWDVAAASERPAPVGRLGGWVRTIWLDGHNLELPERGKWLWFAALGGHEVWDVAIPRRVGAFVKPREVDVLPDNQRFAWSVDLSPDRTRWAVGKADGSLVLWDLTKVRARLEEAGLGWGPEEW